MHRRTKTAAFVTSTLSAAGLFVACTTESAEHASLEMNQDSEPSVREENWESGKNWDEAEALFRSDPRWLGSDVSYSIDLDDGRVFWLFGDTFVATSSANVRRESTMVRSTVAVQTGRDPSKASIAFAWREDGSAPAAFFEGDGENWYWPQHGARLGGDRLVVFLDEIRPTPGQGLGFEEAGWALVRFDGTKGAPATWPHVRLTAPASRIRAVVGTAVVRRDGYLVAFAHAIENGRAGFIARFREDDLASGVVAPEWWTGSERGWLPEASFEGLPEAVMDDLGSECSVHFDAGTKRWIHVASRGFGATTIAVRTAPALEGPWSDPVDVFTPVESRAESRDPNTLVYAAKAHPELLGASGGLVLTYATNSTNLSDLLGSAGADLYWPRVVRLRLP